MSRYLGPLWRISRRLGISIRGDKKEFSRGKKRTTPPGQHGNKKQRKSVYGLQNQEKQKIRFLYDLRAYQLRNLFVKMREKKGNIGENVLINCESRFDNLVFRSGLVPTLRMAREWVSHGHFLIGGQKENIPSRQIVIGETISLEKKMAHNVIIKSSLERNLEVPKFLEFDREKLTITYSRLPTPEELNPDIKISRVTEWYSRRI